MAKQSVNNKHRGDKTLGSEMQASGEKLACKSDEIAQTPRLLSRGNTQRKDQQEGIGALQKEQTRQKKELADFFGQGPRVPAPLREGNLIDVVIQRRENRRTNLEEGMGESPLKEVAYLKGLEKVNAKNKPLAEKDGQRGQGN